MQADDPQQLQALTIALNQLLARQDQFEKRLGQIEHLLQQHTSHQVSPEASAPPMEPASVEVPAPNPVILPNPPLETPHQEPTLVALKTAEQGLESKLGLTLVNRIGVVTLVLGVAFFFKWAVDNNWIGPAGRVILGLMAAFIVLGAGDFTWRKGQTIFAQGITATGVCIIYLALYAAFDFYHLIPQTAAFIGMVATTAMAAALALRYRSLAIAALGLAGAYVTPLLLSTGEDHPWFLFSYLLLLNFAAAELAKRGGWPALEFLSFGATTLIYGLWLVERGMRPEKQTIATLAPIAFTAQRSRTQIFPLFSISLLLTAFALAAVWKPAQSLSLPIALSVAFAGLAFGHWRKHLLAVVSSFVGFWFFYGSRVFDAGVELPKLFAITAGFALFFAWTWWHTHYEQTLPSTTTLSVFSLNGVVYYAQAYLLLREHYHPWLGPLAALLAASYLGFALTFHRTPETPGPAHQTNPSVLLALGLALAFLTLAIPIQFTGFTITIAWAIQAAALTWIAQQLHSERSVMAAMAVLALVFVRLILFESETLADPTSYALLWNSRFLTFAISAAAMLLSAFWGSKISKTPALISYFAGHVTLLWGLILEIFGWTARSTPANSRESVETIAISTLFGVYAVLLVIAGVATRSVIHRLSGLGLFAIVVLKLYFFDVWQLSRVYQIAAFVILGILLLSTSFLYSHFRRLIETWWKHDKTPV